MKESVKRSILEQIEQLKRDKPENWKRDARQLVHLISLDEVEIPRWNSDIPFIEHMGRKNRSTKIQPPF